MKVLFVCALFIEAKPLIDKFDLKKIESLKSFQFYGNSDIYLVVTGTGKINVAVGTTLAFMKLNNKIVHVINFGLCGSPILKIGKVLLVNKVTDSGTERSFYPDNLYPLKIQQKSLLTVPLPLTSREEVKTDLVDMEGSAFFEAASSFTTVDKISLLKVVSDNLNRKKIKKTEIQDILKEQIGVLEEYLQMILKKRNTSVHQHGDVDNFFAKIHLTATQKVNFQAKLQDISVQKEQDISEIFAKLTVHLDSEKSRKENGTILYKKLLEEWKNTYT